VLPANVVKSYLGHSSIDTTNRFYSIVDESHVALTKQVMDRMLQPPEPKEDSEANQDPEPPDHTRGGRLQNSG